MRLNLTGPYFKFALFFSVVVMLLQIMSITYFVITGLSIAVFLLINKKWKTIDVFYFFLILTLYYDVFSGNVFGFEFDSLETSGKMAALANILGAILVVYLLFKRPKNLLPKIVTNKYLILFIIIGIVSTLFAFDFSNSLSEIKRWPTFLAVYFLVLYHFNERVQFLNLIQFIYGLFVFLFFVLIYKLFVGEGMSSVGKFLFFLAPLVLITIRGFSFNKFIKEVKIHRLILTLLSLGMLIGESRRMLIGIVLIWGMSYIKSIKGIFAFIPFIVILLIFIYYFDSYSSENRYIRTVQSLESYYLQGATDENIYMLTTTRDELWSAGLELISENFLYGVGPGNVYLTIQDYGARSQRIHNFLLDTFAQSGIFAFIIVIILIIVSIRELLKAEKYFKENKDVFMQLFTLGILVGFIASLLTALFGGHFLYDKMGWMHIGVIGSILVYKNKISVKTPASKV